MASAPHAEGTAGRAGAIAPGPLGGVRVLDLTTVVVGPACTLRLADYGAEIVKVEPAEGDLMRRLGGPSPTGQHSGAYLHFNRGKRNICLDLKRPQAREPMRRLLDHADVFISNMRPEALERLELDAARLRAARPGLVHCTITGFGPGGPYRGRPAYDSVVQGGSGIAGLFGRRDGTPCYVPLLVCDHVVAEIAAGAVMAALLGRARTGLGAAIEVPMFETMAAFVLAEHLGPRSFVPPLGPLGDARSLNRGNRPLPTADGWISLTANTDAQVRAFLKAVGREDVLGDPRFRTVSDRFRNADAWFALRGDALRTRTTADWLPVLAQADIPAMPCHTPDALPEDPHLAAVGLLGSDAHPTEGPIRTIRSTILEDGAAPAPGRSAAPVGWDTREVLGELGFGAREIEELIACGAATEARRDAPSDAG